MGGLILRIGIAVTRQSEVRRGPRRGQLRVRLYMGTIARRGVMRE